MHDNNAQKMVNVFQWKKIVSHHQTKNIFLIGNVRYIVDKNANVLQQTV